MSLNPARITAIVDRVMANHGFRKEPVMDEQEFTAVKKLGRLAAKDELTAANINLYPSMRESLIRRATRYRQAQQEEIDAVFEKHLPREYPHANVLSSTKVAKRLDWTSHVIFAIAAIGLFYVMVIR